MILTFLFGPYLPSLMLAFMWDVVTGTVNPCKFAYFAVS